MKTAREIACDILGAPSYESIHPGLRADVEELEAICRGQGIPFLDNPVAVALVILSWRRRMGNIEAFKGERQP